MNVAHEKPAAGLNLSLQLQAPVSKGTKYVMFVSVEEWEETNGKGLWVGVVGGEEENQTSLAFQKPAENHLNRVIQTSNTVHCFDNLLVYGILNEVVLHLLV